MYRAAVAFLGVSLLLVGCATGANNDGGNDGDNTDATDNPGDPDARATADSAGIDATPDARPDAMPDAACVPATVQLLANNAFDLAPVGTMWNQDLLIDPTYPLITGDDGVVEDTAPYKAWLGGFTDIDFPADDAMYQDIAIPASTTALTLTYKYQVATSETGSTAYDGAWIDLNNTADTLLAEVKALDNTMPTTSWIAMTYAVPAGVITQVAGGTLRLRISSSNDVSNATSFYVDTMSLTADVCEF